MTTVSAGTTVAGGTASTDRSCEGGSDHQEKAIAPLHPPACDRTGDGASSKVPLSDGAGAGLVAPELDDISIGHLVEQCLRHARRPVLT